MTKHKQASKQASKQTKISQRKWYLILMSGCSVKANVLAQLQSHKIQGMPCTEDSWVKSQVWRTECWETISKCAWEKYSFEKYKGKLFSMTTWEVEKSCLFGWNTTLWPGCCVGFGNAFRCTHFSTVKNCPSYATTGLLENQFKHSILITGLCTQNIPSNALANGVCSI